MKGLMIFLMAGLTLFVIGSLSVMIAIAWSHYPFAFKDFLRDFLEALKGCHARQS